MMILLTKMIPYWSQRSVLLDIYDGFHWSHIICWVTLHIDISLSQDPYISRPLPYIIGSQAFYQDDDVGLVDEPSGKTDHWLDSISSDNTWMCILCGIILIEWRCHWFHVFAIKLYSSLSILFICYYRCCHFADEAVSDHGSISQSESESESEKEEDIMTQSKPKPEKDMFTDSEAEYESEVSTDPKWPILRVRPIFSCKTCQPTNALQKNLQSRENRHFHANYVFYNVSL